MNRHPGGEAATLRLLELAGIAPPLEIIDLGAGDGETVRLLRSLGHRAVGIDLSPGPDVEHGDILSPPFAPGSFDAAVSQCALLLTGNVPAAFSAAHTLLRSGGVFMYYDVVPGGVPALKALPPEPASRLKRPRTSPPPGASTISRRYGAAKSSHRLRVSAAKTAATSPR